MKIMPSSRRPDVSTDIPHGSHGTDWDRLGAQTWGAKEHTTLVSLKFGFFMFLCCVYNDQISVSRCVTMCVSDPGTLQQLRSGYRQGMTRLTWRVGCGYMAKPICQLDRSDRFDRSAP